jgi:hypothetical protein
LGSGWDSHSSFSNSVQGKLYVHCTEAQCHCRS